MIEEKGADSSTELFCDEAIDSQDYEGSDSDMNFYVSTEEYISEEEEQPEKNYKRVNNHSSKKKITRK